MLWVKSAIRFRRPASLTEGLVGVGVGVGVILLVGFSAGDDDVREGEGEGLRLRTEPLAGEFWEAVEVEEEEPLADLFSLVECVCS